jgi:hypothetical protein
MEIKLMLLGLFSLGMLFGALIGYGLRSIENPKKRKSKFPKCDCKDPNDCFKWCNAKAMFSKDSQDGKV